MKKEYCVIIKDTEGRKVVSFGGLDGKPLQSAISAVIMIESFSRLFPQYYYEWELVARRGM